MSEQTFNVKDEVIDCLYGWGIVQSGNDTDGYQVGFSDILAPDDFPVHVFHRSVGELKPADKTPPVDTLAALQAENERLADRVRALEGDNERLMRERDDENRQKRQLHLVYMMTVEQLALAVGLQTIEGKSTQDLIEMATAQRKALAWYADEKNYCEPDPYLLSPIDEDFGERARAALEGAE